MARSLERLQQQYNRAAAGKGMGMRPGPGRGGPGGPGRGGHGRPKDAKKTILRMLGYLKPYRFRFVLVLVFMLVSTLTSLVGSYFLAPVINKLTEATVPGAVISMSAPERIADRIITAFTDPVAELLGSEVLTYILTALLILLTVYLLGVVTTYVQSLLMLKISQGAVEQIRNDLFTHLQTLPVRYFDRNPTGEIMSRFTNDIDNIDTMLNNSLTSLVSGTITLLGTFLFMVTTNLWLTLITVVFVPLFVRGGGAIAKRSSKYYGGQQAALGAVNGYVEETVTGQKVIKIFNHEQDCVEEFSALNDDMRDKQFKAQFWGGVMGPIMGNTSQISYAVTVGVGGVLMCTAGLTPGALTVFANYSRQFSMPINMLSQQTSTVFAALAGAERVFAVMDEVPETEGAEENGEAEDTTVLQGDVQLRDVSFGYLPGKTVLKHISLYAKPGQKIAFVGSTGAGKTTITNLLNRFYDIDEGQILIDGRDIREYRKDTLRRNIAMRLADGYQTRLEGDGANLSQGQRQLLNIARAALSKAPILVLDEATSSVDTRTERHIEHGMDRLMKNRTTFVIAHRLSTVRNADVILVLEQGEIIERGSHDALLQQKGRYYELYTGQRELD